MVLRLVNSTAFTAQIHCTPDEQEHHCTCILRLISHSSSSTHLLRGNSIAGEAQVAGVSIGGVQGGWGCNGRLRCSPCGAREGCNVYTCKQACMHSRPEAMLGRNFRRPCKTSIAAAMERFV